MIRSFSTAVLVTLSLLIGNARADALDAERLLEKLTALEARIATLEAKNGEYRRELENVRRKSRGEAPTNFRLANAAVPIKGPISSGINQTITEPSWTGVFWGVSAGGAATKSNTASTERVAMTFPGNAPPFDLTGFNTSAITGPAHHTGGFIDVFAGWDVQLARLVLGGQVEATVSDLDFSSSGTRSYAYFDSAGPTGASATGIYRPQVTSRWMASALLRAGVLIDDHTLLYGLGGWTYAQFEARNLTDNLFFQPNEKFSANGPTVGLGLERKLDSRWRVRAEYRYTKFDTAHAQDQVTFVSGPASQSQSYSRSTQFDQSMQSGRIGFAYSFNPLR
jgi:outer membrane immunogenic protein